MHIAGPDAVRQGGGPRGMARGVVLPPHAHLSLFGKVSTPCECILPSLVRPSYLHNSSSSEGAGREGGVAAQGAHAAKACAPKAHRVPSAHSSACHVSPCCPSIALQNLWGSWGAVLCSASYSVT